MGPGDEFSNDVVPPAELPVLNDEDFAAVHPDYLKVSLAALVVTAVAVFAATVLALIFTGENVWVPVVLGCGALMLIALVGVARVVTVRHIAYQVRERDVSYRSGVLNRTVSTIPFVRVQHARVKQGPVERRFDLATLEINSAGPDVRIKGLAIAEAERLKQLVVERAGDLVEDE